MIKIKFIGYIHLVCVCMCLMSCDNNAQAIKDPRFIVHVINPEKQTLQLKDENNTNYFNFKKLKNTLNRQNKKLLFATNGGMFNKHYNPQGLYIEDGKLISETDFNTIQTGNFYLLPNGVFYLTHHGNAVICKTESFVMDKSIKYATQSGPMLVIDDKIHSKFTNGSKNLNIRNGVGVLPNGNLLFAMSKEKINFYDFANFFKEQGCKNALYLDGFVSKTYLPSKNWTQLDGNFGVIIAETETIN